MNFPVFIWLRNPLVLGLTKTFVISKIFSFKTELTLRTVLDVFNEEFSFESIGVDVEI